MNAPAFVETLTAEQTQRLLEKVHEYQEINKKYLIKPQSEKQQSTPMIVTMENTSY
jgi:hypothetical protein